MRIALSGRESKVVPGVLGCVVLGFALLVAGCTSSGGSKGPGPSHSPPTPTPTKDFATLSHEAQGLLTPVRKPVLHGVTDAFSGVKDTDISELTGQAYVLESACAGSGELQVYRRTRLPHSGPLAVVKCGGSVYRLPFKGGDLLSFSIEPDRSAGAVAWQVVAGGS